jgi:hypothetical protein
LLKDYNIFKRDAKGESAIGALVYNNKLHELRDLFATGSLSESFNITAETSDENTLRNIIINMFKHIRELEESGVTKQDMRCVKEDLYSALENITYIDDEVLLAGSGYLLTE